MTSTNSPLVELYRRSNLENDEIALTLLSGNNSVSDVARLLKTSESAILNRLTDPKFRSRLLERINHNHIDLLRFLQNEQMQSAMILVELRDSDETPASVRVKASQALSDMHNKVQESVWIMPFLAAIEARMAQVVKSDFDSHHYDWYPPVC